MSPIDVSGPDHDAVVDRSKHAITAVRIERAAESVPEIRDIFGAVRLISKNRMAPASQDLRPAFPKHGELQRHARNLARPRSS
jgi:hypothetical protein